MKKFMVFYNMSESAMEKPSLPASLKRLDFPIPGAPAIIAVFLSSDIKY